MPSVVRPEIDPDVIDKVIYHLCCREGGVFTPHNLVQWDDTKFGKIHEIRGMPQFGKTKTMFMLGWILYFKYGTPMILVPRSDSAAYSDIKSSIKDFNALIKETIHTVRQSKRGCPTDAYGFKYVCTRDKKAEVERTISSGHPFVYARVGTAGNVRKIADNYLPLIARKFGASPDGYINACVMIDEAQNTIQHSGLHERATAVLSSKRFRTDRAYHIESYDGIREALMCGIALKVLGEDSWEYAISEHAKSEKDESYNYILPPDLKQGWDQAGEAIRARSDGELFFGLFNCVRHVVLVSATMTPTHINQRQLAGNIITVPTPTGPHCGFHHNLEEQAQIKCTAIVMNEKLSRLDKITDNVPALFTTAEKIVARDGFDHFLVSLSTGRNAKIDEAIDKIREQHWESQKAVVIISAYASSTDLRLGKRCGVRVTGNRKAQLILKRFKEADQALHTAPLKRRLPEGKLYGDDVKGKDRRTRKLMRSGGDLGQYGEIHSVPMHGSQEGAGAGAAAATSALEIRLPKTSQYRVRASLDIVHEAIGMSGIALDGIKIITIGATLLREGVTVKTNNHRLATTAMIICASLDSLKKWDHGRLIQVTARTAGLMHKGQRMPELFAPKEVIEHLREAYKFQEAVYDAVDQGSAMGQTPVKAIREQDVKGFAEAPRANIAKKNQQPRKILPDVMHGSSSSLSLPLPEEGVTKQKKDDSADDNFVDDGYDPVDQKILKMHGDRHFGSKKRKRKRSGDHVRPVNNRDAQRPRTSSSSSSSSAV